MLLQKVAKAQAVLACFELISDEMSDKFYLEAYQNGRESGFAIISFDFKRKAAFSEFRRSDDIVVYLGKASEFAMQGNVPSDRAYEAAHFFRYNEPMQAAQAIYDFLNQEQKS